MLQSRQFVGKACNQGSLLSLVPRVTIKPKCPQSCYLVIDNNSSNSCQLEFFKNYQQSSRKISFMIYLSIIYTHVIKLQNIYTKKRLGPKGCTKVLA